MYRLGVFIVVFLFISNVFSQEQKIPLMMCAPTDGKDECLTKFKKRMYLAHIFEKNYQPEMRKMLLVTALSARLIKNVEELSSPELQKKFTIAMLQNAHLLGAHATSINTEELQDYSLKILGQLVEEAAKVAADAVGDIPMSSLVPGARVVKVIPSAIAVIKTVVNDFPKVSLVSWETAKQREEQRAQSFRLLSEFTFDPIYQNISEDVEEVLNIPFATFLNETREITPEKLLAFDGAVQLDAMSNLLDYQSGRLELKIDQSLEKVHEQITKTGEQTLDIIQFTYLNLKTQNEKILDNDKKLAKGQEQLASGQYYIMDGVDFLAQSRMEDDELKRINSLTLDELAINNKVIGNDKALACEVAPENTASGVTYYRTDSIIKQKCVVRSRLFEKAQEREKSLRSATIMTTAVQTTEILGQLGVLAKDKNLQKISADATKVIQGFQQAEKAMESIRNLQNSVSLVAGMASFMTGVGALTSVVSLFSGGGSSADEMILKELAKIKKAIAALHDDMNTQFMAVNNKLKSLGENLNNSLLAQTRFLSQNQLTMIQYENENTEKILNKLEMLDVIDASIDRVYQKEAYERLIKSIGSYHSMVNAADVERSFQEMLNQYWTLMRGVEFYNTPLMNFEFKVNQSVIFDDYSYVIKSLSPLKNSDYGKNILLSSLVTLNRSTPQVCTEDLLPMAIFANFLTQEFIKGLEVNIAGKSFGEDQLTKALSGSSTNKKALLGQINDVNKILSGLQKNLEQCLGVGLNEETLLVSSFELYASKMRNHIEKVNQNIKGSSNYRNQILAELKQDVSKKFAIDEIFNGQTDESRMAINDEVILLASNKDGLNSDELATKVFMQNIYPKIGLCFPNSKYNENRKPIYLDFPKATFNKIIKDNYLKIAIGSGLVQWNFCFEVGAYDETTQTKEVILMAKQRNTNPYGESTQKVMGLWPLKLSIPVELKERASANWKMTHQDSCINKLAFLNNENNKKCHNGKNPYETISYVSQCFPITPKKKKGKVTVYGQRHYEFTECEQIDDVVVDVWVASTVNSTQALDQSWNEKTHCDGATSNLLNNCFAQTAEVLNSEKFKERTEKISTYSDIEWQDLVSYLNVVENEGEFDRKAMIQNGVESFYIQLRTAYSDCYFSMLKGSSYCQPFNGTILLPPPDLDLKNLDLVSELILQLPSSFYQPISEDRKHITKVDSQMSSHLAQLQSPLGLIQEAELLYQSGMIDVAQDEIMDLAFKNQKRIFEENVIPLLKKEYQLDRSLLVPPNNKEALKNLEETLKEAI